MNEKAQIENYLDQKVNPLMEELLTNIIKNRPKNIVSFPSFSSTIVEDGLTKRQNICKCSQISQTQIQTRTSIELYI